jgi:hypothetical protein
MSDTAEQLPQIFDELERCKPWIEAAISYGGGSHTFKDVVDGILTNKMQFWPSEKGCIVTEIIQYPQTRNLHIFLAGGDLEQILDYNDSLKEYASLQGCDAVTLAGRPGWKKVLKDLGYEQQFIVLKQRIDS